MRSATPKFLSPLALVAVCALAVGCKSDDGAADQSSASSAAAQGSAQLTPDQARSIEALVANVDDESWTFKQPPTGADAVTLAVHAANSQKGDAVTGAALTVLTRNLERGKPLAPEVRDLILQNLAAEEPRLAGRAATAAMIGLDASGTDPELVQAVLELSEKEDFRSGEGRYTLLSAAAQTSTATRKTKLRPLLLSSLNAPEAYVAVTAIEALDDDKLTARSDTELRAALLPLLGHSEAAVRGVAARSLGELGKGNPEVEAALIQTLTDASAFVRAQACVALGISGSPSAVHALIPLADDVADSRIQYTARSLEQQSVLKSLNVSHWPHVAHAAQYAIQRLAPEAPRVDPAKPKDVTGSLRANGKILKAWYAKHRPKIPTLATAASGAVKTP